MNILNCFFHLMMIFMLYSYVLLILISYIQVESGFETVEITSDKCKRHFPDSTKRPKSTLDVFYMYGPCSPAAGKSPINMPSAQDILHRDQLRVESLQAPFKSNSTTNKFISRFQDTKEVAYLPVSEIASSFAVSISLGTPQQMQTLVFDTGSVLTWTRGFHYYASTSFQSISCDSPVCTSLLPTHTCEMFDNKENMCYYNKEYADGSSTKGVFSTDILNITETCDVFSEFRFGCPTEFNGNIKENGILGLGKNDVSFVSQTAEIYKRMFSYCLPSSPSSTGFLKLGPRDYPDNLKFTPLLTNPNLPSSYSINITSIKVGDVELLIDKFDLMFPAGIIIDSGTVITYLPMNVYKTMRNEFHKQITFSGHISLPSPYRRFDTCYDYSMHESKFFPNITFIFEGGVTVDMDVSATLYVDDSLEIVCLAFAGNSDVSDLAIFGNFQQKKLEVVYDVYRGKLGFIPHGCP
ncbi:hypothetical protein CASFOL_018538 [Castilleja foliolosa]|uniref:Peptidase A1 domain-containing protein n=1 Tax=Castilleja foliolosa TaxID=1961234 RepID=A0ABD3D508_9LAMI